MVIFCSYVKLPEGRWNRGLPMVEPFEPLDGLEGSLGSLNSTRDTHSFWSLIELPSNDVQSGLVQNQKTPSKMAMVTRQRRIYQWFFLVFPDFQVPNTSFSFVGSKHWTIEIFENNSVGISRCWTFLIWNSEKNHSPLCPIYIYIYICMYVCT